MSVPAGLRNGLIVVAIAAAIHFTPGGGRTADVVGALLSIAIIVAFVLIGVRLYREHRTTIFSLGERHRGYLYGALAVIVVAMGGRERMWDTGPGILLWLAAIGAASYALVLVWRHWREYSF